MRIDVGEVWLWCALANANPVNTALTPFHVGVSGGDQVVGHAVRSGVHSDEGIVMLQVDVTNAFDTFSLDDRMKELPARCTSLARRAW